MKELSPYFWEKLNILENEFDTEKNLDKLYINIKQLSVEFIDNSCKCREDSTLDKLGKFQLLLDEIGFSYTQNIDDKNPCIWQVKNQLFMNYVKTFCEIIHLLKSGYIAAALSRERLLYELIVYWYHATKDEIIAERFLKNINNTSRTIAKQLGELSILKNLSKEIKSFGYGDTFFYQNAWARPIFNMTDDVNCNITFKKLAEKSEIEEYYSIYSFLSIYVHASLWPNIYGVELSESEKDGHTWITTPNKNGTKYALAVLYQFTSYILKERFVKKSVHELFVYETFKNIVTDFKAM